MEIQKTVILQPKPLKLRVGKDPQNGPVRSFRKTFRIGRSESCAVQIADAAVSREHVELRVEGMSWRLRDLGSANGTYLNGRRITNVRLPERAKIELGVGGPQIWLAFQGCEQHKKSVRRTPEPAFVGSSVTQIMDRYSSDKLPQKAGQRTMMFRQAFQRQRKKQSKKFYEIIAAIGVVLIAACGLVAYQYNQLQQVNTLADDFFYRMKNLELELADLDDRVQATNDSLELIEFTKKQREWQAMNAKYQRFVNEYVISKHLKAEDRLILRMVRIFGESEIDMPASFIYEVKNYIRKWRSSPRMAEALKRAHALGYVPKIVNAFLENDLPPQFFYLALQESDFRPNSIGLQTRYGIAKGIWQLMPRTARSYALKIGPLYQHRRYDPRDERYDFDRATAAAVEYVKDIYQTEAQGSGMLALMGYNWGEGNVRSLLRRLPENPRDRNFWNLLAHHKDRIPRETYDYVFYIFSAAVIGENPRLFGFDFENPLRQTTELQRFGD